MYIRSDSRQMVINNGDHPYNGIGKIIVGFYDSSLKRYSYKNGTAFLITYKHIMTAAHTLYRNVDERDPFKAQIKADKIEFFLEPLFLKEPVLITKKTL